MSLSKKWIQLIHRAATGNGQIRTLLTPIGALFFFIIIALFISLSIWMDKLLRFPNFPPTSINIIVGILFFAIGVPLWLWSLLHFIKARGTPVPFNPPPKLISTGPYAHFRNPMLTGVFIMMFGLGMILKSISLFFIFTPLFILINVFELKSIEEPELEKRLNKEYLEYKKKVPMFIPRLKKVN